MSNILKKTHPKSRFIYFTKGTNVGQNFMSIDNSCTYDGINYIILQVMSCGDKEFCCEIVRTIDFDSESYFKDDNIQMLKS